jgi:ribonuclease HII
VADFEIEASFAAKGVRSIAGVDEVGRGALCGPVVAAAVILPFSWIAAPSLRPGWLRAVDDSKLLTPRRRRALAAALLAAAAGVGFGACSNLEVDRLNIHQASLEAMRRAVEMLPVPPGAVLVDGFGLRGYAGRQQAVIGGDRKSLSIAAASILAKVLRDQMMDRFALLFPGYGLERNKGYATAGHIRALAERGPSAFHRTSFRLQFEAKLFP